MAAGFAALVDEGLQAFNVGSWFGHEATTASQREAMLSAILGAARTLPMMAPRRVVVVHEAEALLTPRRAREDDAPAAPARGKGKRTKVATTPAEDFEAYVESPEPLTTLVLVTEGLDRTRRITKQLLAHAAVVDCGALQSEAEAARWIRARLERDELQMEPRAVAALLEGTGLRLGRIRAEVEKLVLYAAGDAVITEQHVRDLILPQVEPGEDFALGRAIWAADAAGALREVAALLDAGAVPVMLLGQIRAAAARLRPDDRARQGLDRVLAMDAAVKSSAGEPRHLLERLVVELCAGSAGAGATPRRPWSAGR